MVTGRPQWIPRKTKSEEAPGPVLTLSKALTKRKSKGQKVVNDPHPVLTILSTVNDENITVDKIQPTPPIFKRGRKKKELPQELIRELAGRGMGSKRIASTLLKEHGIVANYRTIARLIAGQQLIKVC